MKKFLDFIFSMQFALTLMLVFAFSIAIATFIENDFGTPAAKAMVYSATWFEILLAVTAASMLGNILRFKLIQRKKYNVLIFHTGFIVILLGAAITRFTGYEGSMHIRENEKSNRIISDQTYLDVVVIRGQDKWNKEYQVTFVPQARNKFRETLKIGKDRAEVELKEFFTEAAVVNLTYQNTTQELVLAIGEDYIGKPATIAIGDVDFTLAYGARYIEIPFYLELRDFQLDRYPGSMSPSSFASEITLMDERHGVNEPRRIFMNNVLNYGGFRFYQSSYDRDEFGTVLSVNHDFWGTFVTYTGYVLMAVALVLNFFSKKSRFRFLIRESNRIRIEKQSLIPLIAGLLLFCSQALGQTVPSGQSSLQNVRIIDKDHARLFGELMVQDNGGRIKPVNTLSSELLRKVYRKDRFMGLNSDQVLLGMISDPMTWQKVPMIRLSDESLKSILGTKGKFASYEDFINLEKGTYKISNYVDEAYNKKPAQRNAFDKDIMKVDERMNICYMIYTGSVLRIFPCPGDSSHTWVPPVEESQHLLDSASFDFVNNITTIYLGAVNEAIENESWKMADESVSMISIYQEKYGKELYPSEAKKKIEIIYNRLNIFKRLYPLYGLLGFLFLILLFTETLSGKQIATGLKRPVIILIGTLFVLHTLGLAARWYISGHAPWSNGYETMIYIAWATVLSGLIFARRSYIALAITTILASLTLMVGNMAWLDPQITNLVPVLKSYWLIIHVAVITASYSFLAIGALVGFLALVLINFRTGNNRTKMSLTLEELTNINEINLTIGLVLVSIGTFLGAVWANESWGRYWGWDPKETWALITMLVYSFIIHMRMIPGLRGNFAFNFAALLGFSSVLMTYFGVNYYLYGLHSYASGDPVPIPTFVYYTLAIIAVVSLFAWLNERKTIRL